MRFGFSAKLTLVLVVVAIGVSSTIGMMSVVTIRNDVTSLVNTRVKRDLATVRDIIDQKHPGQWSLQGDQILKGVHVMNEDYELIDEIGRLTGNTVTVFRKDTRVCTNVLTSEGKRAVGTSSSQNVADAVLKRGGDYVGRANVVGQWYQTAYEPVRDSRGDIIGMLYTGTPSRSYDSLVEGYTRKLLIAVAVAIAAVVPIAFMASALMTKPIREIVRVVGSAAQGDLRNDAAVISRDEFADLTRTFNSMLGKWRAMINSIMAVSNELERGAQTLMLGAEEQLRLTGQVQKAFSEVSRGAHAQNTQMNAAKLSIDQLSSAIAQIATGVQDQTATVASASDVSNSMLEEAREAATVVATVREAAEESRQAAASGYKSIEAVIAGMPKLEAGFNSTLESVSHLDEGSKRIGLIVEAIGDIADQTNLLALNAAIEAARAGEHGRGFAVVADEVRKLAERSSRSVGEISTIIMELSQAITVTIKAVKNNNSLVSRSSQMAEEASQMLNSITSASERAAAAASSLIGVADALRERSQRVGDAMTGLAAISEENSASVEEVSASTGEITSAIGQVAKVTADNSEHASSVEESARAQNDSIESVRGSAKMLSSSAQKLNELVSYFATA
ncbi:MAG: methyl-accepting chemotaxis protein [Clostridia bacterium]|nr:methyl-accepting chemotaxis protein [Clostridia bacterium]